MDFYEFRCVKSKLLYCSCDQKRWWHNLKYTAIDCNDFIFKCKFTNFVKDITWPTTTLLKEYPSIKILLVHIIYFFFINNCLQFLAIRNVFNTQILLSFLSKYIFMVIFVIGKYLYKNYFVTILTQHVHKNHWSNIIS